MIATVMKVFVEQNTTSIDELLQTVGINVYVFITVCYSS